MGELGNARRLTLVGSVGVPELYPSAAAFRWAAGADPESAGSRLVDSQ